MHLVCSPMQTVRRLNCARCASPRLRASLQRGSSVSRHGPPKLTKSRRQPQLWDRIAAALPAQAQSAGLWHSLTFWRGFGVAAGALAAACLAALIYLGTLTQQPPLVATIEGGGHRHFVATLDAGRGTVAVVPAAFSPDATRVPELWLIPPDGKPRPVGLLRADQTVTLTLPADLAALARKDTVLAVSLEPPGGSTTGLPTGPVIATGKLTSL